MIFNYIKLAIRLLIRNPFFAFINVLGLSVGFAVFYILIQHSSYELKSDQFHKDHERIFRLYFDFYHNTGVDWTHYLCSGFPAVFTTIAKEKFTEIESTTRIIHQDNFDQVRWAGPETDTSGWRELNPTMVFSFIDENNNQHSFAETNTVYADPNLFEFFSVPLLIGIPENVLSNVDAIVLSASTARKYFGESNPVGKVLTLGENESFTVTGVFRDLPKNTHLNFELVLSTLRIQHAIENVHPLMRSTHNYFKIRAGTSVSNLESKMNQEQKKHWDWKDNFPGSTMTVYLQPLKDAAFRVFDNDVFSPKSKYIAHTFQMVAIIVFLMAWINYMNLKLSMQAARIKELAARKTAGASRNDFIKQFLMESLVINGIAILAALTLVQLLTQPLETMFHFYIPAWNELTVPAIIFFLTVIIMGILIAGLQPAFSVWGMTTRKILGHRNLIQRKSSFGQITTVFQFVSAIALIVWLFSISKQVDFITKDSWGIDRNEVIVIELPVRKGLDLATDASFESNINSFKDLLFSTPGIKDVAISTTVAGDLFENSIGFYRMDTTKFWAVSKSNGGVDERFLPFYGLRLLAGRNFLPDHAADKRSVILSRLAAKTIGLEPEQAIGKMLFVGKHPWRPFGTNAEIIGVVEDYRYNPLYLETGIANANRGTLLTFGDHLFSKNKPLKMSLRMNDQHITETIALIQEKYRVIFPNHLFHWYFLNDHMNAHYQSENIARNQILLFTVLAIGIACLGLVGMISNKMVEKTKEIGIRKVLGANLVNLVNILLHTTMKQIAIGAVIGIPVAYFITQEYLEKFSERISIQWWQYVLPLTILLVIMFMTISTLLWKALRTNPVDSLRYE